VITLRSVYHRFKEMGAMEYLQNCRLEEQPLVVSVVLVALLLLMVVSLQRPRRKLPPSPSGAWPIVGHLPLLGKRPHITMANLANKYGPIYWLQMGSIPAIVVSSPEMAKEVLQIQEKAGVTPNALGTR
jgi:hypothetical protein